MINCLFVYSLKGASMMRLFVYSIILKNYILYLRLTPPTISSKIIYIIGVM